MSETTHAPVVNAISDFRAGDRVLYTSFNEVEKGTVTSVNSRFVFVRYDKDVERKHRLWLKPFPYDRPGQELPDEEMPTSKATLPTDLQKIDDGPQKTAF